MKKLNFVLHMLITIQFGFVISEFTNNGKPIHAMVACVGTACYFIFMVTRYREGQLSVRVNEIKEL